MPGLLYGVNRSLDRARMLLKSLVAIGVIVGITLGCVATIIPRYFPYIFTPDQLVIREMHKVLIPFFLALSITPPTLSLEGTLLAGQDLKYVSTSNDWMLHFGRCCVASS
ncbi:hypothetical protein MLD38_032060 [Melastoma candidum]|uniref:Uncharacterized protein n=1 Tax=Melastoma candidum TaxID=119954 RepID=A0ACB9M2Z0_9MYRT|nr:hypothetical protein MLD38_032060 [Melastoma candidum]